MVARTPLALVLAVALAAPFVSANEAPVIAADVSDVDVVLGQPVLFTDASTDDGAIVAVTWEDSDGRMRPGASVTLVFGWAGIHTITQRVTDDLGATSRQEILVLVRAPIMSGRAFGASVGGQLLADTGDVSSSAHEKRTGELAAVRNGGLIVAGMDAEFFSVETRAVSRASVEYVKIPHPLGYNLVTGIETHVISDCGDMDLTYARFTQLRLNDAPLVPPGDVPPNTRLDLPGGGSLVLNAQGTTSDGRVFVTGLLLSLPGQETLAIAHSEAGVAHCPYRS